MLRPMIWRMTAWFIGSVVAYVLASLAHTQTILAGLTELSVTISWHERLTMSIGDLIGLRLYGVAIGLALAIGLPILFVVDRRLPPSLRYALAGAISVATALLAMRLAFSFTPIASAREPVGFTLQCFAGAAGGFAYARARRFALPRPRQKDQCKYGLRGG